MLSDRHPAWPSGTRTRPPSTRHRGPFIRPMGQGLIRALPIAGAGRLLDVGTGVGALFPDQRAAPEALVVGVNGTPRMLRLARTSTASLVAAMDARCVSFRRRSFDATLLDLVRFHLPDAVAGLFEVARVPRTGAVLGATTCGGRAGFAASDAWDEALAACGPGPDPVEATGQDGLMDTPAKVACLIRWWEFEAVEAMSERFEHR